METENTGNNANSSEATETPVIDYEALETEFEEKIQTIVSRIIGEREYFRDACAKLSRHYTKAKSELIKKRSSEKRLLENLRDMAAKNSALVMDMNKLRQRSNLAESKLNLLQNSSREHKNTSNPEEAGANQSRFGRSSGHENDGDHVDTIELN